jgi:hypothetical protein
MFSMFKLGTKLYYFGCFQGGYGDTITMSTLEICIRACRDTGLPNLQGVAQVNKHAML